MVLRGAPGIVDFARQRPQRQRRLDAFAAQSRQDAQRARHIARQRSVAELEDIEARAVAKRRLHGGEIDASCRPAQQLELLELLLRGEQVAFGAIDDELHGVVVELERSARRARAATAAGARLRPARWAARRPRSRMP